MFVLAMRVVGCLFKELGICLNTPPLKLKAKLTKVCDIGKILSKNYFQFIIDVIKTGCGGCFFAKML